MARYRNDPKPKPIEEWGAEEWEKAYDVKCREINNLKYHMRIALQHLSKAVQ